MSGKDEGRPLSMPDLAQAKEKVRAHHAQMIQKGDGAGRPSAQAFVETTTVDNTEWSQIVEVKGRGRLTALGVAGGHCYHGFRVEIDGRVVVADTLAGTGVAGHINNGLGVDLPFVQHLRVEGRDEPEGSALATYWVSWVLDQAYLAEEATITKAMVDETEHQTAERRYLHDGGAVTTVTASLGPRFVSEVRLLRDWFPFEPEGLRRVGLAGQVIVHDLATDGGEEVLPAATGTVRPAGRWTPVAREIGLAGGEEPAIYVPLPGRGEYSIAADLSGVSNRPSFFTVL